MKSIIKYAAVGTAIAALVAPTLALAVLTQPTPPIGSGGGAVTGSTITRLLEQIAQFILTISVIIAVIVIVYAGVLFLRNKPDEGKQLLTRAAIGLAIIFGVGLLMQTIARLVQTQSIG